MFEDEKYQKALEFVAFFEDNFTCSGICSSSLFYYTLPMASGPPRVTCLSHMKGVIGDNLTYMGMLTTLCGMIMFFTWICQYPLQEKFEH